MECLTFDSLKTKLYNEFTSYGLRVICCPIEGCQETYAGIQVETGTYRHELMIDKTRIPQGTALLLKDLLFFTPKGNGYTCRTCTSQGIRNIRISDKRTAFCIALVFN